MSNKKGHRIAKEVKADILRRGEGRRSPRSAGGEGPRFARVHHLQLARRRSIGIPSWGEFSRLQKQNRELFEVVGELTVKLSQAQKKN